MRTVKSEKEKERIRERVKEIGGRTWEDGYKELADALDAVGKLSKTFGSKDEEEAKDTLGDSLSIAREADRDCRIKVVPFDDTIYASIRPAYEEFEDIYHQWFPEDGDAPFTTDVFKELPKRIIASALETIVASEITELVLSLTDVRRRNYDTPFLSYSKKRIAELVKRFSLNTTNISKLALGELEKNFSLPRNDSYYNLLNYLFGPDPIIPTIIEFVQAKHPGWFTYKTKEYTSSDSSDSSDSSKKPLPYSLDDSWLVFDSKVGKTITKTGREIVVGIAKGTLSEEDAFRSLPGSVQAFIKEELEKYKLFSLSKSLYGDWSITDEGVPLSASDRAAMADMIKILKSGMVSRLAPEPETESVSKADYSPILSEKYYSVLDPATGVKKDMTKEELKIFFKESRGAFMESRTSKCEYKD